MGCSGRVSKRQTQWPLPFWGRFNLKQEEASHRPQPCGIQGLRGNCALLTYVWLTSQCKFLLRPPEIHLARTPGLFIRCRALVEFTFGDHEVQRPCEYRSCAYGLIKDEGLPIQAALEARADQTQDVQSQVSPTAYSQGSNSIVIISQRKLLQHLPNVRRRGRKTEDKTRPRSHGIVPGVSRLQDTDFPDDIEEQPPSLLASAGRELRTVVMSTETLLCEVLQGFHSSHSVQLYLGTPF